MNEIKNLTPKEEELLQVQNYLYSQEWVDIEQGIQDTIRSTRDYIIEDSDIPQECNLSRNILRARGIKVAQEYIEKISNEHLRKVIKHTLVQDNETRMLMFTEVSNDLPTFSHKDWCRMELRLLSWIASFPRVY